MYEELRQTFWASNSSGLMNKNQTNNVQNGKNQIEVIDLSIDDDDEETNDNNDRGHCHLWCICRKPWDHSRLMLRCDSCANWYHGDW